MMVDGKPAYSGFFVLIMFGFLLQWPTLLTLLMFPVLVYMYVRLARRQKRVAPGRCTIFVQIPATSLLSPSRRSTWPACRRAVRITTDINSVLNADG